MSVDGLPDDACGRIGDVEEFGNAGGNGPCATLDGRFGESAEALEFGDLVGGEVSGVVGVGEGTVEGEVGVLDEGGER